VLSKTYKEKSQEIEIRLKKALRMEKSGEEQHYQRAGKRRIGTPALRMRYNDATVRGERRAKGYMNRETGEKRGKKGKTTKRKLEVAWGITKRVGI